MRLAAVLALLLIASCTGSDDETGGSVVWIVCNGLRADRAASMASLRSLEPVATTYERAVAPSTHFLPSLASLFTGTLPSVHGAHTVRTRPGQRYRYREGTLALERLTLAEALRERGYTTALFTSDRRVPDEGYGLRQGFDKVELGQNISTELTSRVMRWLDAQEPDSPTFLVVHFVDTQIPYAPPPGELRPASGSPGDTLGIIGRIDPLVSQGRPVPDGELELLRARYDESVASLDVGITALLDDLKHRGWFDDATIVLTAENGQSLGEHFLLRSGRAGVEPLLHVPLVVKAPRQSEPVRVRERRSLLPLASMMFEHAGLEPTEAETEALFRHAPDDLAVAEQWYAPPTEFGKTWSDRFDRTSRILYLRNWKLIDSDEVPDELYDVVADPGETRNRLEDHPGIVMDMRARLEALYSEPR